MNELGVALIFQDRMVLQRNKSVYIWGTGPDNETVKVSIQGREARSVVQGGTWSFLLPPLETSESETLLISCADQEIALQDIAIGEVWIAGGQSNMEFFLRYDEEAEVILKRDENRNIRFFDYPEVAYPEQIKERDYSRYGVWRISNPDNLEYFSAVGYHFAERIFQDLGVPVGIIGCNWGGTPACTWMDTEYLKHTDGEVWIDEFNRETSGLDMDLYLDRYRSDSGNFRNDIFSDTAGEALMFGMPREDQLALMNTPDYSVEDNPGPYDKCRPGGLFGSMVSKVAPYTARGFLWYQGESDDKHPDIYRTVFSSLIQCWRDIWKEDLPFLFVQLAPFKQWLHCTGVHYPVLRAEQDWVSRNVQDVWMASIMDAGEEWDIHPRRKKPVGVRLALLALGKVYGKEVYCESPEWFGYTLEPGKLILKFLHAEGGLKLLGERQRIEALELSIDSLPLGNYRFECRGAEIIIHHESLQKERTIDIRFAEKDYCRVDLYNAAELPVKPFHLTIGSER